MPLSSSGKWRAGHSTVGREKRRRTRLSIRFDQQARPSTSSLLRQKDGKGRVTGEGNPDFRFPSYSPHPSPRVRHHRLLLFPEFHDFRNTTFRKRVTKQSWTKMTPPELFRMEN